MKNFILLFYFISYATGIGTLTLSGFYYFRTKTMIVKYLIMMDLFLTMMLTFDTLSNYDNLFTITFPDWLELVNKAGFFILDIGLVYYTSLSVYSLLGMDYSKRHKARYFLISISLTLSGVVMLSLLYIKKLISGNNALNSASVLSTVFIMVGCVYYMIILMIHWNKINQMLKRFVKVILITTIVLTPTSILINVIAYWVNFSIPIAFSPIVYFIFNLVGMVFAARNLTIGNTVSTISFAEAEYPSQKFSAQELVNMYKLTEREAEIVLLVTEGCSNQEIGDKLFISPNTVRNHIANIYQKMNIKNRYELISIISSMKR